MKEALVQAEKVAAEITRKLEKQKKCLKEEKKQLAGLTLAPLGSSSAPEECEETWTTQKEENAKAQKIPQENGLEEASVSLSKHKKKKPFFKEEVGSDLEETAGSSTSSPQEEKIFT